MPFCGFAVYKLIFTIPRSGWNVNEKKYNWLENKVPTSDFGFPKSLFRKAPFKNRTEIL
jgi:hypothetical protein